MNLADAVLDQISDGDNGDEESRTAATGTDSPDEEAGTDAVSAAELSTDDVFHVLQTKRRRDVLRYLQDVSDPVRMRDLAEQVAAWEQETSIEALSSDERQRVYISLYQSHLPKLDEEGIVEYDKDRGIVERTPLAAAFDPYIDEAIGGETEEVSDPWPERYAAAVLAGVVALGAAGLDIAGLSAIVAGAITLVAVTAVTVAHTLSRRERFATSE
ncbi:hypothetical protein OB955_18870 [Halobacteria archaeon AArc-m2/3/4]|uniref:DUF7344 domain-containing protein n=1 Tax=Natronoglomus mannanivorans TaxID=2979990 RepID=A0ABT2QIM0_9EURY|nr:hypothetical protein [Halobacteria archaeon AArc-m2/3/4]